MTTIWILAAMQDELDLLKQALHAAPEEHDLPLPVHRGRIGERPVGLAALGIGVAAASLGLGLLHRELKGAEVIMVGSAGALPGSGLITGDLAVAEAEWLSELGLPTGPGTADARALGLPGLEQSARFDARLTAAIRDAAERMAKATFGPFLTVLSPSADLQQAGIRAAAFQAVAENMEGYALAAAARTLGCRAAEIRGVSNQAGDRDKHNWDLVPAQRLAQAAVLQYLKEHA